MKAGSFAGHRLARRLRAFLGRVLAPVQNALPGPGDIGSHGAQPEWHDLEAPFPQRLAKTRGYLVQPACPEDPQEEGPPGQGSPYCPASRVRPHQAHREVSHRALPHESPCRPRIQPGGAEDGGHPQEICPDDRDLRGPQEAQPVHRSPAGQRAAPEGVPLQAHPLPPEAVGPQEGGQLRGGAQDGHAAHWTSYAHQECLQEGEGPRYFRGGEELQGLCQPAHGPRQRPALRHPGQASQGGSGAGCGKEEINCLFRASQ